MNTPLATRPDGAAGMTSASSPTGRSNSTSQVKSSITRILHASPASCSNIITNGLSCYFTNWGELFLESGLSLEAHSKCCRVLVPWALLLCNPHRSKLAARNLGHGASLGNLLLSRRLYVFSQNYKRLVHRAWELQTLLFPS